MLEGLSIGQIVISSQGRDKGAFMIIVGVEPSYVYLADGKLRKAEKPKKKKIKHIRPTHMICEDIKAIYQSGKKADNAALRKALKSYDEIR